MGWGGGSWPGNGEPIARVQRAAVAEWVTTNKVVPESRRAGILRARATNVRPRKRNGNETKDCYEVECITSSGFHTDSSNTSGRLFHFSLWSTEQSFLMLLHACLPCQLPPQTGQSGENIVS